MINRLRNNIFSFWLLSSLLFLMPDQGFGQESHIIAKSDNTFVKKLRRKEPRPKFFAVNYTVLKNVYVDATSATLGNSSARINTNTRFSLSLKAPILLKPNLTLLGGYSFATETFKFGQINSNGGPAEYYNDLGGRSLTSTSVSIYMKKNFTKDKFMFAFLNAGLHSDRIAFSETTDQFKSNIAFIFVKNTSPISQIGYGGGFGYIFGGPIAFPIFIWNRTFSAHWNLEAMLPKGINFRYTFSPEMYLILINEVDGGSYFLRNPTVEGFDRVTFQRSAFITKLSFEREIYDWLWFGVDIGYNVPINLYLGEPRKNKKDAAVVFNATATPIFNFTIFAVVPKKIYYKASKPR